MKMPITFKLWTEQCHEEMEVFFISCSGHPDHSNQMAPQLYSVWFSAASWRATAALLVYSLIHLLSLFFFLTQGKPIKGGATLVRLGGICLLFVGPRVPSLLSRHWPRPALCDGFKKQSSRSLVQGCNSCLTERGWTSGVPGPNQPDERKMLYKSSDVFMRPGPDFDHFLCVRITLSLLKISLLEVLGSQNS